MLGIAGLFFALVNGAGSAPGPAAAPPPARFKVGYRVLDLKAPSGDATGTLTVAVWYPTEAAPKRHRYGGPTIGNVAVDAAPRAGGYPLLVFSHGYGGSGLGAQFLAEALAARGWIVACPDHHDRHSAVRIRTGQLKDFDRFGLLKHAREISASGPADRGAYLYRLDELRLALDGLLASDPFGQLIDRERIAVGGHSFGGFTALGLSGTLAERRDPRIKAVLLFSTGAGGYLFTDDELAAVRIPSLLFMGERERDQRRGEASMADLSSKIYRRLPPPKYFLEVGGAGHFSFNNRFADSPAAERMSGTEAQFAVIRRYAIAFLEKHVAGRGDPGRVLERGDPRITRFLSEGVRDPPAPDRAAPDRRRGGGK